MVGSNSPQWGLWADRVARPAPNVLSWAQASGTREPSFGRAERSIARFGGYIYIYICVYVFLCIVYNIYRYMYIL